MNKRTKVLIMALMIAVVLQAINFLIVRGSDYSINSGFVLGFIQSNVGAIIGSAAVCLISGVFFSENFFFSFFFAGVLSNITDRIAYHGVIDYINLPLWPSFNVADVMIVFGVVAIMLTIKKEPH